ncbi:hypothetical protein 16Q_156 [Pseudomonas phage 16Q]|nr:hypothetical protein 16Q_156 [Pseudomonas phage 16Q]
MKSNYKRFLSLGSALIWYEWCKGCGKFTQVDFPDIDYDGSYWVNYYK